MPRLSRSPIARFAPVTLLGLALLAAACSTDFTDGDAEPAAGSPVAGATPTSLPAMTVVTPTPVVLPTLAPGETPTVPSENPATYVVAEGDTLYAIALRFGVDLQALIELNGLSDPNDISVGQELQIPPRPQ